jgi:hypothetical protein
MTQRISELAEPALRHTRDFYRRLNELTHSHPHIPVHELVHFLNHPPSEAPAKPTADPPKPRSAAQILWPYMEK